MRRIRIPLCKADEYDALTRWRHVCLWRPGERKKIKRRANRRERHTQRHDIGEQGEPDVPQR